MNSYEAIQVPGCLHLALCCAVEESAQSIADERVTILTIESEHDTTPIPSSPTVPSGRHTMRVAA